MASRVNRFKIAQEASGSGFAAALEEIQSGGKRGHWIWYVFPQLSGLGGSALSHTYAIGDPAEAVEYLRDPLLRSRLMTITEAVAAHLTGTRPRSLITLMGSEIDVRKLVSSLTLFATVARALHAEEGLDDYRTFAESAHAVLAAAESQGYPRCAYTLRRAQGG